MLSHTFYERHTAEFFPFLPGKAPISCQAECSTSKLAALEAAGKLSAVVTQNIDGLHQAAGSRRVYELHGSVLRNCERCHRSFSMAFLFCRAMEFPNAPAAARVKPDVVLYEETSTKIRFRARLRQSPTQIC